MPGAHRRRVEERPIAEVVPARSKAKVHPWVQFYRNRTTQRVFVVLVLAAVLGLQYRLVNMPVAELKDTQKFESASIKAGEDTVSFIDAKTEPGQFRFGYAQPADQKMIVDAYFDSAALSEETLQRFAALGIHAPSGPAHISYKTDAVQHTGCSTEFEVETVGRGSGRTEAQFFQDGPAPSNRHRSMGFKMAGLDSTIKIVSGGAFAASGQSPCRVTLQIGEWSQPSQGFLPIKLRVSEGSGFRFSWEATDIKPTGWPTEGGAIPLLWFGSQGLESFHAGGIEIRPSQPQGSPPANAGLIAICERKQSPFTVDYARLATNQLEIFAEGRGRTTENGKVISKTDVLGAISQYPLAALLLGAINMGLMNWARRVFFGSSKAQKS
jgi:hypothetical protein